MSTAAVTGPGTGSSTEDDGGVIARRRRGEELEDAIRRAAMDELVEVGFASMSMENVAARAQTGKASVYRRWPTKHDLVLDLVETNFCGPEVPHGFDFDDDVTTAEAFHIVARNVVNVINSPFGDAIRVLKCEASVDPALGQLIDERFQRPRNEALLALLRRGVARGEVRPEAVSQTVVDVVPAMLTYRLVLQRRSIDEKELDRIVDEVLLPLITP